MHSLFGNTESAETVQYIDTHVTYYIFTSHTIITLSLTQTIKNIKFGSQIPNPNTNYINSRKGRLFEALVLGVGILDTALYVNQYRVSVDSLTSIQ